MSSNIILEKGEVEGVDGLIFVSHDDHKGSVFQGTDFVMHIDGRMSELPREFKEKVTQIVANAYGQLAEYKSTTRLPDGGTATILICAKDASLDFGFGADDPTPVRAVCTAWGSAVQIDGIVDISKRDAAAIQAAIHKASEEIHDAFKKIERQVADFFEEYPSVSYRLSYKG